MNLPRGDLNGNQYAKLQPLLPPKCSKKGGRPYHSHRRFLNAMLFLIRTGIPWRDLPERYGSWKSVYTRFSRWVTQGIWSRILRKVIWMADKENGIDWDVHHIDSTICRVHQHAAGAKRRHKDDKKNRRAMAIGKSRGGLTTKVHLRVDRNGKPMSLAVTEGQRHDSRGFYLAVNRGAIYGFGKGRPNKRPKRIIGDKGYDSANIRRWLKMRGVQSTIPRKKNAKRRGYLNIDLYKERNIIERTIGRAKQNRRLATRYEKNPENYEGMWEISAVMAWLPVISMPEWV